DTITSATLLYEVVNTGNAASVHEVLVDWQPPNPTTYNNFGGDAGVQEDEYGVLVGSASGAAGMQSLDVTSSIVAWKANPGANRGWIFRPTGGTDGVEFSSSNHGTSSVRPKLVVVVNGGAPPQKTLVMKHQPYLQLGDAPLRSTGPGIGATDQMVIAWQTIENG